MDQDLCDASFRSVDPSAFINELHGLFALFTCDSMGVEIEPLPWLTPRVTANPLLENSDSGRTKGAVAVEDQERTGCKMALVDHVSILP